MAYIDTESLEQAARIEDLSYQQLHAEIETNNELVPTFNLEFWERRGLDLDEVYCQQIDTEFEGK